MHPARLAFDAAFPTFLPNDSQHCRHAHSIHRPAKAKLLEPRLVLLLPALVASLLHPNFIWTPAEWLWGVPLRLVQTGTDAKTLKGARALWETGRRDAASEAWVAG